jgi:hypothetical protein
MLISHHRIEQSLFIKEVTATRTLELDGATTLIGAAPNVTAGAGELGVARTVVSDSAVERLVSVTSARSVGLTGADATVQAPPSASVDAGQLSVSRSTVVDVSAAQVDITATRAVSLTGAGVSVQAPPTSNVNAGRLTPGRSVTESFTVQSPYSATLFTSALTASANTCDGGQCATDTAFDSVSDSAPNIGGETVDVQYDLGTVSTHSSGSVTIKLKDSSGSVLASRTQTFDDSQSGQTLSFQEPAPAGTVEIVLERSLTADSQDTSGGFQGCSVDSDCTDEDATIQSPITVQEV